MVKEYRIALTEAISDTAIAFAINLPLNIAFLYMAHILALSIVATSVFMTVSFTVLAVIRKTFVRVHFSRRNL